MSTSAARRREQRSGNGTTENTRPVVSIAMCTYNGEAYLSDQLASIVKQTRRPDELIACDDGSTDNTLRILEGFSKEAPFAVRACQNEQRLGPTKNFEKAVSLCSGDFVLLSDQDDVWMPEKVDKLVQALSNNPDAGYVFSDALVVDEKLRPMGYTMWQSIRFTPGQRRRFKQGKQLEILLKRNVVTGATIAFRAQLKSIVSPFPDEYVHDEWIALLASASGMYGVLVEEPLIRYRQHPGQAIGARKTNGLVEQGREALLLRGASFQSRLRQAELKCIKTQDRLILAGQLEKRTEQLLADRIQHLRVRHSIHGRPRYKRAFAIFREALTSRYYRFSFGCKSVVRDFLL